MITRRKRYKQARFWRGFISDVERQTVVEELRSLIFKMNMVEKIQIEYGWTTWVTVTMKDGTELAEGESRPLNSLKNIAHRIYKRAVGEYLTYINSKK
jgi:hypothetical protein